MLTLLQKLRIHYQPRLPHDLLELESLVTQQAESLPIAKDELAKILPRTYEQPVVRFKKGSDINHTAKRVGVVLSGGQAAGGHNVITGLFDALKRLNPQSRLFGFLDGPAGIIENSYREITEDLLATYRNQGGFDLIGSGRTKIETADQFQAAEKACTGLNLDGLAIIGGDDSNTNASLLAEYFKAHGCKTAVVGVPKTIDGDLKNAFIEISFGFDSATKTFSEIIGNIARDALSQKKYYYFIKLMGRSASHIALECALQTKSNMTLIGEEIEAQEMTLDQITHAICDVIAKRAEQGKNYGVILIPEGVIEFIPEFKKLIRELNQLLADQVLPENVATQLSPAAARCFNSLPELIQKQLLIDRDPHGNVQVSKIESERLFIELCTKELKKRQKAGNYKGKFAPQPHFCGYEGRSCFPSNFDSQYCYALGYVAALLIDNGCTGYMSCVQQLSLPVEDWQIAGIPLVSMMHMEERGGKAKPVIRKALVDLNGLPFHQFATMRDGWAINDDYIYPGPIQFFGPPELTEAITLTLEYECESKVPAAGEDE